MFWKEDTTQALDMLRRKGFSEREVARLGRLHRTYKSGWMDQAALDSRRLEFVRWLVAHGKVSDQYI